MVAWKAVAVAALMIAFAGCAEVAEPIDETEPVLDDTPVADNATADPAVNATEALPAPEAIVSVWLDGNVTEADNGTYAVPADTNVTLDAAQSLGDNLTFAWTLGNDTFEGASVTIAFNAGEHTVHLTALQSDGQESSISMLFNATSAQLTLLETQTFAWSMSPVNNIIGCAAADHTVTFIGELTDRVKLDMDMTWAVLSLGINFHTYLFDADGNQIFKESRSGGNTNFVVEKTDLGLPAGDYTFRGEICGTFVPQGEYDMKGEADHYA